MTGFGGLFALLSPRTGSALQLRRSESRLRLDWIVAAMTFLATLALLGALTVGKQAGQWRDGLRGSLTIELPVTATADPQSLDKVLALLRAEPAVARAEPLSRARVAELLAPWLGTAGLSETLPVPQLIDVALIPGARIDAASLSQRLAAVAPGITVDDHGRWLNELLRLATLATLVAVAIVVIVTLAAVIAVTLSTRAGLALQQQAIGLLHLIGAEDRYIAHEFARDALTVGLRGGLVGFATAVLTIIGLFVLGGSALEFGLLPRPAPGPLAFILLTVVPLAAAALCALTAWVTVVLDLRQRI